MHRSRLVLLLPLLGVAGCISLPGSLSAPLPYRCDNGMRFTVIFDRAADSATLQMMGDRLLLAGVSSAAGARYTDGKTTLVTRGTTATLERVGLPPVPNCKQQTPGS